MIRSWGSAGTEPGQFDTPWDVALDTQNYVYVPDYGDNRIQVLDDNGTFLYEWESHGNRFGEFGHLDFIAFDEGQKLYVTNVYVHWIQIFFKNSAFISTFGYEGTGQIISQSEKVLG